MKAYAVFITLIVVLLAAAVLLMGSQIRDVTSELAAIRDSLPTPSIAVTNTPDVFEVDGSGPLDLTVSGALVPVIPPYLEIRNPGGEPVIIWDKAGPIRLYCEGTVQIETGVGNKLTATCPITVSSEWLAERSAWEWEQQDLMFEVAE